MLIGIILIFNSQTVLDAYALSLFASNSTPAIKATTDSKAVELGVRFTSDVNGYIKSIRFYKGTTNVGPHRGNLWTSTGVLLGSLLFANETQQGWQQASFASPIPITANIQYIASYHTASGNYAFDRSYFNKVLNNPPLHAPATINGVYVYGSGGFPSSTYQSSNYWVDLVFENSTVPTPPDTTNPTVSMTAPVNGSTVFGSAVAVSATASDNVGVMGVQFQMDGANLSTEDISSPYLIMWDTTLASNGVHTLLAVARDAAGNRATSTPFTVTVNNIVPQPEGSGGVILIVTAASNPFTRYYKEILLAEGFNMYHMVDISNITLIDLANYDVVILGQMPLNAVQASMFTNWVNGGGNLIAMYPDSKLSGLLGITAQNTSVAEKYFMVNNSIQPGQGIVGVPLQFHGTANLYNPSGAAIVATLYLNQSTSLNAPAVTLNAVGSLGGHAAAFLFDLARSVVYTRQGNPAWAGQRRVGDTLTRTPDLFFGNALFDPQPDWVDFTNIQIPQADESQRLLVNMIYFMMSTKKPLPHFWYLPRNGKAAIIMTGDDHGNGGTVGRFQQYQAASAPGCSVIDWQCIRSTSYIYASTPISDAQAADFVANGFEIASHILTNCADWTYATLDGFYTNDLAAFSSALPSVPAPQTIRTHCGTWSDYDSQPQVETSHNIRFDTNYYYWPDTWVKDRPGMFTGSGFPMRFADRNGNTIDSYQATTQMPDESGESFPLHVDTLLDNALGAKGYYGMFTVNAHTDYNTQGSNAMIASDAVVNSAVLRGVPVISAKQALEWLDGKTASSFSNISWNTISGTLTFSILQDSRARGINTLIPTAFGNKSVTSVKRNGFDVSFKTALVKGIYYTQFYSDTGTYNVAYTTDAILPSVTITFPLNMANVSGIINVNATASDNIGVVGVQFLLDGANIDQEDTTAPYGILWNTVGASTGAHTLIAVARDAVGNKATSTPVTVTVQSSSQTFSLFNPASNPSIPAVADPNAVELGVRFTSDFAGYINAIRFYKGSTNIGPHVGNLWTSTGALLGSVLFTNETQQGWQQASFASPIPITANTQYIASYHTASGNYAFDISYFATAGVDNIPLHAPAGTNGVYVYGSGGFPSSTYQSSNYWVDLVFANSNN